MLFHAGVSILEGGYDLDALQASALAHVKVLMKGYPHPGGSSPNVAGRWNSRLLSACVIIFIHNDDFGRLQ